MQSSQNKALNFHSNLSTYEESYNFILNKY